MQLSAFRSGYHHLNPIFAIFKLVRDRSAFPPLLVRNCVIASSDKKGK